MTSITQLRDRGHFQNLEFEVYLAKIAAQSHIFGRQYVKNELTHRLRSTFGSTIGQIADQVVNRLKLNSQSSPAVERVHAGRIRRAGSMAVFHRLSTREPISSGSPGALAVTQSACLNPCTGSRFVEALHVLRSNLATRVASGVAGRGERGGGRGVDGLPVPVADARFVNFSGRDVVDITRNSAFRTASLFVRRWTVHFSTLFHRNIH
ncbi:hypothetical protein K0M31_014707 [Melipona bicolor]|uniref:Uncharacterized protein n=1 Tax=Melipona bicolor TaxID=60889 RepID=A0AA40KFR7_9HYME|nr:hypothetical protein K0M31_014707 [Melipona bicolor]